MVVKSSGNLIHNYISKLHSADNCAANILLSCATCCPDSLSPAMKKTVTCSIFFLVSRLRMLGTLPPFEYKPVSAVQHNI